MKDQWPRANLRAALREVGYDAIGTRTLLGALAFPPHAADRGPVAAILVDASAAGASAQEPPATDPVGALARRYGPVPQMLLASAVRADPPGEWARVLRRPFSIQDVVAAVSALVPLPEKLRRPIDG